MAEETKKEKKTKAAAPAEAQQAAKPAKQAKAKKTGDARLRDHYKKSVVPAMVEGVRLQERDGGAEDRKGLGERRPGRGHAECQADGRRGERTGADRGPKAGNNQG